MPTWLLYVLAGALAYCLGSISTGILVSRAFHGPDLHTVGSHNTGATNVQRTMGWVPGLITFAGDSLKAVLACYLGQLITGSFYGALLGGLLVVLGHNWPVFFHFQGGKGVASSCGVMLFCFPIPALICFGLGVVIILLTKYISLASMSLLCLYAVLVSFFYSDGNLWIILWSILLALLCLLRHRANIVRLLHGTENRLGQKVKS
ncbi:MAG: glycerol-3-phosphate 1-O-acyltransferase PlsY [Clostridia bacterium]|nr:glycerol-3-phosphate 1-O-acyltransferase PlsY [Clostridia bacterium]